MSSLPSPDAAPEAGSAAARDTGSGDSDESPDATIVRGAPPRDLKALALKLLAAREHSRLELKRKLIERGCDRADADAVLDALAASGALNEARLAERYVAERADKGFGPLRIRAELADKGLPDDLIEPYLAAMSDEWPERLAAVQRRRFGAAPPRDRADYARRGRFLEQRGFPAEAIRRCLSSGDRWAD